MRDARRLRIGQSDAVAAGMRPPAHLSDQRRPRAGVVGMRPEGVSDPTPSGRYFHPAMPPAASTASVTSSLALEVIGAIWTGFSMPISIGPIIESPPSSRRILAEILADCRPGMMSTLAGPDSRANG